jgi:hypothetical protein
MEFGTLRGLSRYKTEDGAQKTMPEQGLNL